MMKRKDPTGLAQVGIRAFLYQVPWSEGVTLPDRQSDVLKWLDAAGAELVHERTESGSVRALRLRWRSRMRAGWAAEAAMA